MLPGTHLRIVPPQPAGHRKPESCAPAPAAEPRTADQRASYAPGKSSTSWPQRARSAATATGTPR
jgi:hypothetical protein